MAVVTRVFDVLTRKLQKLQFNPECRPQEIDENSSSSSYDYFINDIESKEIQPVEVPPSQTMELDLLEKKIRRLILKLKKHNIYLHIFDHSDIHYGPTLGKGGEGIVQKCTVRYNDLLVDAAVKTVLNSTEDGLDITFDEIEMLCLAHDPIMTTTIKVYGVAAVPDRDNPTNGHLVIITEAGIKNALQLYQDETIPLHVTYNLWHCLAVALHCIHKKNIIHQDLKPENVLITGLFRDNYGMLERVEAKVIDLGMARLVEGGKVVTEDVLGTTGYHSPEVLFDETYDFKADVFVLGVTFCVMLLNQSTLRTAPLQAFLKRIHEAKERGLVGQSLFFSVIQSSIDKDVNLSPVVREMICKMLERVDRRSISLLEVAATCQQESLNVRQHPNFNNSTKPQTCHDSGIDSCDYQPRRRTKRQEQDEEDDNDEDNDDNVVDDNDDDENNIENVNPHNLRKNRRAKNMDLPGENTNPGKSKSNGNNSTPVLRDIPPMRDTPPSKNKRKVATRAKSTIGKGKSVGSKKTNNKRSSTTPKSTTVNDANTNHRSKTATCKSTLAIPINTSPVRRRLRSCTKKIKIMEDDILNDDDDDDDNSDGDYDEEVYERKRKRIKKYYRPI